MQFWFVNAKAVIINFFQDGETRSLNSALKARSVSVTNMLEKLVMEKELKFVAFAEEVLYKSAYSIFVCLFKYRFR